MPERTTFPALSVNFTSEDAVTPDITTSLAESTSAGFSGFTITLSSSPPGSSVSVFSNSALISTSPAGITKLVSATVESDNFTAPLTILHCLNLYPLSGVALIVTVLPSLASVTSASAFPFSPASTVTLYV